MEGNRNPLVSVVVPVYNVEKYIARCIESILNQTHNHLELILVNDGSPDRSGEICDEYALKDDRIKVFHTPNRGVSHARNTGLEHASGEYLLFVDSDDWVEDKHIEMLLPIDDEDLVYSGRKFFVKGKFVEERVLSAQTVDCSQWLSDYTGFVGKGLAVFFVSGCYRMEIIRRNGLQFDTDLSISEDGLFNIAYMKYCRKIRYTNTSTYCYEDGDASSASLSNSFHLQRLEAEIQKVVAIERMTNQKEYCMRWNEWKGALRHYRKWMSHHDGIYKKQSKEALKKAYKNTFFRESISYIRKKGSLDQKVETFFMSYWLHPFYEPCYSVFCGLSKLKQSVRRKSVGEHS